MRTLEEIKSDFLRLVEKQKEILKFFDREKLNEINKQIFAIRQEYSATSKKLKEQQQKENKIIGD